MKKTIIALAVAVTAISSFAQGHVNFVNGSTTRVSTNSTVNYLGSSLVNGTVGTAPGSSAAPAGYLYALLAQSYTSGPTVSATLGNVLSGGWTFTGLLGTNALAAGSINGVADATSTAGLALASGNQFVIVGWSATLLGLNSWSAFSTALLNATFTNGGYVGISSVGTGTGIASPPQALFIGTGITTGFTLFSTTVSAVPEPGTMALAALGGASLLLFRRKK